MPAYKPPTLAKTLAHILYHAPHEYGLFWNADGTMPWKEFYWALQEDPELRFVREAHIREINYLGIEFPARLEGNQLHLHDRFFLPIPARANDDHLSILPIPKKLFFACRHKTYLTTIEHGLESSGRPFVPLFAVRDLADRVGKRRDPEAIVIEILTESALKDGIVFLKAGEGLFLTKKIPAKHLLFPKLKENVFSELIKSKGTSKNKQTSGKTWHPSTPGSFQLEMHHMDEQFQKTSRHERKQKEKRGPDWKRASRKDREKRHL